MAENFLVIDDNASFRAKLKRLLETDWPNATVSELDSTQTGWTKANFKWDEFDVLFLDHDIGDQDNLSWLSSVKDVAGFPGTVVLSSKADPELAVLAIKAGAENYLPKGSLTRKKLNTAVQDLLKSQATRAARQQTAQAEEKAKKSTKRKSTAAQALPEIQGHSILEKIGQGGMSNIYLAEREQDKQQVVIKTLSMNFAGNEIHIARSNQEFKLISRIKNKHIVKLHEHGTVGDTLYTTMEYFPGGDLKKCLRQGITQRNALEYLLQIASGLAAIHGAGIIHRDLKPGNIMFREDGTLAIIDFGISKDINSTLDLTNPGQVMGTPNYMAPEQGNGGYRPDARSDIYSLGVMLYEMLSGKKPYAAPTSAAIIYKHIHDPIPTLPNQFFEVQSLIDRMMCKFPHERFQSAFDLIEYINAEYRWDITTDLV